VANVAVAIFTLFSSLPACRCCSNARSLRDEVRDYGVAHRGERREIIGDNQPAQRHRRGDADDVAKMPREHPVVSEVEREARAHQQREGLGPRRFD